MDELTKHFKGKTTSEGHELILKKKSDAITIGFKHSGEYEDQYDPYIKVARVEQTGDAYRVGWFHDDAEEPSDSSEYTNQDDLFAALEDAIEKRSKEVGPLAG
jgi:hypothetical protein